MTVTRLHGNLKLNANLKVHAGNVAVPAPQADFFGNPLSGSDPLSVVFTDQSTGSVNDYSWDFGDGDTSAAASPTHIYASAGVYTVSLTVSGAGGNDTEIKTNYIQVSVPVVSALADFTATPLIGDHPLSVTFSDQSTGDFNTYAWDFGDADTSSVANPVHVYASAGFYTVSLTVSGPGGTDTEIKTNYIEATEPAPIAEFDGTPISGDHNLSVSFTDQSTGGLITSYEWDFGDGDTSAAANPTHIFTSAGFYTVSLTVSGPGGTDTETKVDYIEATEPAPVSDFTGTPVSGVDPLSVTFTDQSTGVVDTYAWDFGDADTSSVANPVHVYASAGFYTVSLTVSGPGGTDTETKINFIQVGEPAPVSDFTGTPVSGAFNLSVSFSEQTAGTVNEYTWDFGDGDTSAAANPTHIFTSAGFYTVSLTVSGPGGTDTETKVDYIDVGFPVPTADFTGTPVSGVDPLSVTFTDQSTGNINEYAWDFGDADTSSVANPVHVYASAGFYTVSLTVSGPGGTDTETKIDYIDVSVTIVSAQAEFTVVSASGNTPFTATFTDQSTGDFNEYFWDFGDGNTSPSADPVHTYASAGLYTVTLTVSGAGGTDTETKVDFIQVSATPGPAYFSLSEDSLLKSSINANLTGNDQFGFSVSINDAGTKAAIGSIGTGSGQGAFHINEEQGGTWVIVSGQIVTSDIGNDALGSSIHMSGDGTRIAIGAPSKDSTAANAGAAYVFVEVSAGDWTEEQKLESSNIATGDDFGGEVALSETGDYLAVAARLTDRSPQANVGSVYIFTRSGSIWTEQTELSVPSLSQSAFFFGASIDLDSDGDTIVVGVPGKDTVGGDPSSGAIMIFTRSGSTWTLQQEIDNPAPGLQNNFGGSVSITGDGDTVVVGAARNDIIGADSGAAYVYDRSGSTWSLTATLTGNDTVAGDQFGTKVDIARDGNAISVSDINKDTGGVVYMFGNSTGSWTQEQKLEAANVASGDEFGSDLELSSDGSVMIVGAPKKASGALTDLGEAYIFDHP